MASMIRSLNSLTSPLRLLLTTTLRSSSLSSSLPSSSKSFHSTPINTLSLSPSSLKSSSFTTSSTFNSHSTRSASASATQQLCIYEMNERDRNSPVYLSLSNKPTHSLGDLVPFSNKLYTGCLTKRLGITSGLCILIKNIPNKGDRYEAIYSFYLGDYGSISVQGEYLTYRDTELAVTGGTGIFNGVYGTVKLKQIVFPFKLYYVFELKGLESDLPEELVKVSVDPSPDVVPSPAARGLEADAVVSNFTD